MSLDQSQQLIKLLDHVQIADDMRAAFQAGAIQEVLVNPAEGSWHFVITLPQVLPFDLYVHFQKSLQKSFANIAQVTLSIKGAATAVDEQLLNQYWPLVLHQTELNHAAIEQLTQSSSLALSEQGTVVKIKTAAPVLFDQLNADIVAQIGASYQDFGFPKLSFEPLLDQALAQQIQDNVARHHEQLQESLQKAIVAAESQAGSASSGHGPLRLGRKIAKNAEITRLNPIFFVINRI